MVTTSATSGANIDVATIVSQLMTVEQRPLTTLATKEASYQSQLSAFGSIQGAVSSFQSAVSALSNISKFQALSATPSDSSVLTASASSIAVAGTYAINVTNLAQSQKLAAAGQASSTAAIGGAGATTLTFDFGAIAGGALGSNGKYTGATTFTSNGNGAKTVNIDATNNSLQGIRDAINAANIGVTATIVNDGSATPYRLTLTSSNIGKTNSLKISVAGDLAISNLLAQDPAGTQNMAETVTAQNTDLTVDGVPVSKTSTSISDVIQGVTLNVQKVTTTPVSVTVARDTSTISNSVTGFVKAYNDLNKTLKDFSSYNATTKQAAILQGDFTVRSLQSQLHAVLNTPISNNSGTLTTLSQIGVSIQKDGTMALDQNKLNTAISSNFSSIASLFAAVGSASDSLVSFGSSTSSTKPGSYAVSVGALATRGGTTGNINLNTVNDGTHGLGITFIAAGTTINATVDGIAASVPLTTGSYTATQLATMIQSAINGTSAISSAGSSVAATIDGSGFMNITSNRYSSASNVNLAVGLGTIPSLYMGTATSTSGTDVTGTIDGVAATGSGQFLTSASGSSTGLKIQISGGLLGARGTVKYSQGYAYTLNDLATSVLASGGTLDSRKTGINKSITDIGKQRDALNVRLAAIQANYVKQFSALDAMLGSMNQTSTFLTQQLANLPKA